MKCIEIQQRCKPTKVVGWHRRRLQKMVKAVFQCIAFTDPTGMFEVRVYTSVGADGVYTVSLLTEESDEFVQEFLHYANQVNFFHQVTLTTSPEPVTIPT